MPSVANSSSFTDDAPMPIVGIGASAGGVDALCRFFDTMPDDSGMAFVVVLHLSPDHKSNLASILSQNTSMPVHEAADDTEVRANHIYVISPGRRLDITDGHLQVTQTEGRHDASTIDRFFRSLAADQGENAVGVLLSGTGTDGTLGLRALKEHGGVTMVQDPSEAEYDNMPNSAIAAGLIDLVLPVQDLAEKLLEYRSSAGKIQLPEHIEGLDKDDRSTLQKVLTTLYTSTGHDFSNYKRSMVLRRLKRRLKINALHSLDDYLQRLRGDEEELQALHRDLLISVTNFFRDPEAFETLRQTVIPKLFEGKTAGDQVRVWVPGCATGEEAYSLAILLLEHADRLDYPPALQVFATDADQEALQVAREGLYPNAIASDLTDERLQRFFEPEGDHYRVIPQLRDTLLIAEHNLLTDPPFSSLDLVSCRNLLIYLNQELQRHVFNLIHYGLKENGYLFLGRSEAGSRAQRLFKTIDKPHNILQARVLPSDQRARVPFSKTPGKGLDVSKFAPSGSGRTPADAGPKSEGLDALHQRVLMEEVASVLVNENHEIVHLSAPADRYLQFEGGTPSHDLISCVPKPLRPDLRSALFQAFRKGKTVERAGLSASTDETARRLDLSVHRVEGRGGQPYALVQFRESPHPSPERSDGEPRPDGESELREELGRAREQLQTTSEEYEAATEEMEAANEELLSMNEELQSKNEELETSKEELQSVNEELKTTNQELKDKVDEVREANSILENLMAATEIATLFLDRDLRITRFTPRVQELFNIQTVDVGRPLSDFTQRFDYGGLIDDARTVLDDPTPLEREIHQSEDKWFLLRLRPYRTVEDQIEGVVLTFIDITDRRKAEQALRRSEEFHRLAVEAATVGTWSLDLETGNCYVSPQTAALMGYASDPPASATEVDADLPSAPNWQQMVPREQWMRSIHPDDRGAMEAAMTATREHDAPFELEFRIQLDDGTVRWIYSRGEVTPDESVDGRHLRGAAINITSQKEAEAQIRQSERRYRTLFESMVEGFCVLEVLFDADDTPADYRLLETNPAFEEQTGLANPEGMRMQELSPNSAEHWLETYARIARTGEPEHFRSKAEHLGDRWFDVYAVQIGDPDEHKVAAFFWDVTERRELEQAVVNASEKVRREIGQDLHDILSSDLVAVAMKAENLQRRLQEQNPEEAEALQPIVQTARKSAEQARNLSHALVPATLQEEHLAAALEGLCREQEDLCDMMCVFEGDREETLPANQETAMHMYRIAHEAVVNARRHASPEHVWARLGRDENRLVMEIRDDGPGLPDDLDEARGLGLRTMRYRANLIGATLAFESNGHDGTTVRCSLPLSEAQQT